MTVFLVLGQSTLLDRNMRLHVTRGEVYTYYILLLGVQIPGPVRDVLPVYVGEECVGSPGEEGERSPAEPALNVVFDSP